MANECKPIILSDKERKERFDEGLKQVDNIIKNALETEVVNSIGQGIKSGGSISEKDDKIESPPLSTEPASKRTSFKLPKGVIDEVSDNPVLNTDFLVDLESLSDKTNDINYCDPERKDRLTEFERIEKGTCIPTLMSTVEKKEKRDKELKQIINIALDNSDQPELIIQSGVTGDIDAVIQSMIPKSNLINEDQAQACMGKIDAGINDVKSWNDHVQIELERLDDAIILFFRDISSFDYQLHTLLLYGRRYDNSAYVILVNDSITNIDNIIQSFGDLESDIATAYKDYMEFIIDYWKNQAANYESADLDVNAVNIVDRTNLVKERFDEGLEFLGNVYSRIGSSTIHDVSRATNLDGKSGKMIEHLNIISREPTQQETDDGTYVENIAGETENHLSTTMLPTINFVKAKNRAAAQVAHPVIEYRDRETQLRDKFLQVRNRFITSMEDVINIYEISDIKSQKKKAVEIMQGITCDGKSLMESDELPDASDCVVPVDIKFNTFPEDTETDVAKLKYWQCFSKTLNLIALSPQHYSIGLLLPSPTGVVKVPLPVKWIPLVVIPTKVSIVVIWLTINGIVISPTVWIWKFKPLGNEESVHMTLFRGANKEIKDKTASKYADGTIVNGIDTDPELTKNAAFVQDDIPVHNRLSAQNLLFISYLNKWCTIAKGSMGYK